MNKVNVKLMRLFNKYGEIKDEVKQEEVKCEKVKEASYPPINFSWLVDNKIAGMGCPQSVASLNYLADVGINQLITLSPEKIPPLLECDINLKWTEIRIKEFGAPTLKQIIKFIEICERADIRGEAVGVHCRHGRGRTGTMLACYLVCFKRMTPERAILTVRTLRPGSCETAEQQQMVCHYHDCLRGTISKPDYRLVDDKLYFDLSMKYMYDEEEKQLEKEDEQEQEQESHNKEFMDELAVKTFLHELKNGGRKKSKAMVINHKIYF
ncbi:dual specificity protein phosphatase 23-like [Danaus plexippus]|uniref:dual specificity protein phosphatase 23-like n=1 Tax=Danaus plexippus TaxID=13037 RepID=UPI002AAFA210|nr:dual specificity protein phosphatase 23-like [Danaus plexippus]